MLPDTSITNARLLSVLRFKKFCKYVVTNRRANVIQEFAGGLNSKVSGDFMETENKEICESSTFL